MWKQKAAKVIPIVISCTGVIPKSLSQSLTRLNLHPNTYIYIYVYTNEEICNSWHMFNCKKLFKLQVRPPSLILLITASQDRWIFPSQSWEMRNSIVIIIIIIICWRNYKVTVTWSRQPTWLTALLKVRHELCKKHYRQFDVKNSVPSMITCKKELKGKWSWLWFVITAGWSGRAGGRAGPPRSRQTALTCCYYIDSPRCVVGLLLRGDFFMFRCVNLPADPICHASFIFHTI